MLTNKANPSDNDHNTALPLIVSTLIGDFDVGEEPLFLKRYQICACEPKMALDNCFRIIKSGKLSPYLTILNIGFGKAAVVKNLSRGQNLSFDLSENIAFRVFGNASIETEIVQYNGGHSFPAIKSILRTGVYVYDECKVYLCFRNGDSCNLQLGERIIPSLRSTEDRTILSCKVDDWYDPEWDDWG